jgi:hypothetical protein
MALSILCAGCSKSERQEAEVTIREILGRRSESESWTVSLVKVRDYWSVTLEGPAGKRMSFKAAQKGLRQSLSEAVAGGTALPSQARAGTTRRPEGSEAPTPAVVAVRDRHVCKKCGEPYAVLYDAASDESQELVPVACPHCWGTNHVLVGESAALARSFRAEKVAEE